METEPPATLQPTACTPPLSLPPPPIRLQECEAEEDEAIRQHPLRVQVSLPLPPPPSAELVEGEEVEQAGRSRHLTLEFSCIPTQSILGVAVLDAKSAEATPANDPGATPAVMRLGIH